ncbi:carboxylesterase family protein [Spirosoma areae]
MNHLLTFLLSLVAILTKAQDTTLYQKREFVGTNGLRLPYRILYPENYDATRTYPLILFLHGAGERGSDNTKQLTHGAKLFITPENRRNFPGIVLMPQCPANGYWGSVKVGRSTSPLTLDFDYSREPTPALSSALALFRHVAQTEHVDPKRLYIMGLSMGGMGTFEAVYRNPDLFAAAIPICGGGDTVRYDRRVRKMPFRLFHGDSDDVVGVNNSRAMVRRLNQVKARVEYTEYPGVKHNSWDTAFAEPDLLPWLFDKKRKRAGQ